MTIYQLSEYLSFPPPEEAEPEGLLAIGGDLSTQRLILAYSEGIFPWFSENDPVLWWSPDPRMVLYPEQFKVSKSFRRTLKNKNYRVQWDSCFQDIIQHCSKIPRKDQGGTWILNDMIKAYQGLHDQGFAHSIEVFYEDRLAGGLYGVSLGGAFFGESMFSLEKDASKIAFYHLAKQTEAWNFQFIDCQLPTDHLTSLGATEIPREQFLKELKIALIQPTRQGKWKPVYLD